MSSRKRTDMKGAVAREVIRRDPKSEQQSARGNLSFSIVCELWGMRVCIDPEFATI